MQKLSKNAARSTQASSTEQTLPPQAAGLRDRKKRRTRQAIRAAAIDLFTKHGVDATTVEQIAAAADISPRTFFNYFDSKEEAVSLPYSLRKDASLPTAAKPADPRKAVHAACLALAHALESDVEERAVLLAGVRLCLTEPVLADHAAMQRGRWEQLMLAGLKPTFENRVLVTAGAGAFWAALADWAHNKGKGSLTLRVEQAFTHLR